jgi:molecular chaperone GrpE (heat shock protein)
VCVVFLSQCPTPLLPVYPNFNKNQNNFNSSDSNPQYTNLTSSKTSSIAQTLSSITSTNFIEANNFNNSAFNFPLSHMVQEDDEEEEVEDEVLPTTQVQPSTSTDVVVTFCS